MKIKKEFAVRNIAGDFVMIPMGQTALEFSGLASTNDVGAFLWNLLQEEVTEEELVKRVLEEYEVDEETAKADIREFLNILVEKNILER